MLENTPSLQSHLAIAVNKTYPKSRKIAIKESKFTDFGISILPEEAYPLDCPFSPEQILDEDVAQLEAIQGVMKNENMLPVQKLEAVSQILTPQQKQQLRACMQQPMPPQTTLP